MQIVDDSAAAQIEEILTESTIASSSALPPANMGKGMLNWDVLRKRKECSKLDGILRTERDYFMDTSKPFKWRHFQAEIILLCVRWYLRYPLSYRNLEEMMLERGLHVDHTTIYRWVQYYAPELEK